MPRKLTTTSTPSSNKGHKRQSSATTTPTTTSATRSSKRLKESTDNTPVVSVKISPKKSKYFEASTSDNDDQVESEEYKEADVEESGDEDEDASLTEQSSSEVETDADFDSGQDRNRKTKKKPRVPKDSSRVETQKQSTDSNKELWRPGVKTGLGPGKQVFIAKPKPRGDGGIKYVPGKIHPNTMAFLADLKQNNDREWLKMHDPDYRESWKDWSSFVETLTEKITEVDETIPELPPKDLVFRIYRDVRFSSDPTPYKTHFSAAWSRTGRKGPYAGYYVQIQPKGSSFVGSGLWMPDAQPLSLLRTAVDRKSHKLKQVLMDPDVRKLILGGVAKDEKKVVRAFTGQNSESALKTKPKGYDADNANIELLRLRSFTMGRRLADEEVLNPRGLETILELISVMTPFVTYLNSVVMPDEDSSSSEDSDDSAADTDEN